MKPRVIKFMGSGVWAVELEKGVYRYATWRHAVDCALLFHKWRQELAKIPSQNAL